MTDLQALPAFLRGALLGDVTRSLALAAAWLDPLRLEDTDPEFPFYEEVHDDPQAALLMALGIARRCFPGIYASALALARQGQGLQQLADHYCAAVSLLYPHIALWELADMLYGVPCRWAGLEPCGPDFPNNHPELVDLLADFGVTPQQEQHAIAPEHTFTCIAEADYEQAYSVARPIINSLLAQAAQPYGDLACLLLWLFSASGNSLIDLSYDAYYDAGFETLDWEPGILQDVNEAHQQAGVILEAAGNGLLVLQTDTPLRAAFRRNIQRVKTAHERKQTDVRFHWPRRAANGARGDPGADPVLLLLRDAYAPDD